MELIYLFPGQGSQYVGMGQRLYNMSTKVQHLFKQAGDVLKYDITKFIFSGPLKLLTQTQFYHCNFSFCWQALRYTLLLLPAPNSILYYRHSSLMFFVV